MARLKTHRGDPNGKRTEAPIKREHISCDVGVERQSFSVRITHLDKAGQLVPSFSTHRPPFEGGGLQDGNEDRDNENE